MDKKIQLVKDWLKKAKHDIGMAELALEHKGEFTDSICFHCQQYVEKSLKAYLVYMDIEFAKTHSLSYILDVLGEKEDVSDELYSIVEILEDYAVGIRYPGDSFEPTIEDATEAYNAAMRIKDIINDKVESLITEQVDE